MNKFLFKSRWIALAFAALTLFSTYMLIGGEKDRSLLANVQGGTIAQQDQAGSQLVQPGPPPEGLPEGGAANQPPDNPEFLDDAELIDDASGYDPSPAEDNYDSDQGIVYEDGQENNGDVQTGGEVQDH